MIGALRGTIANKTKNPLLLFVHDVGYLINITEKTRETIVSNQSYHFFIHSHIREDAFDLYGFLTKQELDIFELLLNVSGIGPKTALLVVDRGHQAIHTAIMAGDVDFFTDIPRLGKKNAQKIIIELKSKLGSLAELDLTDTSSSIIKEATEALVSMGFAKQEIRTALDKLPETATTIEQTMRYALQQLGKRAT